MLYSSLILFLALVVSSSCIPISSWTIKINESDGQENCVAKTRTQIYFGTKICQAQFSCNSNSYRQSGIGIAFSERIAIQEAINDSRSQCGRSTECVLPARIQIINKIESQLNFIN